MENLYLLTIGIILWPGLEYALHRFSGHQYRLPKVFFEEHQAHHIRKDYFAPTWKKLLASLAILSVLTFALSLAMSFSSALFLVSGFIGMYLFYEWFHRTLHVYAPKTKMGLLLRKHHFYHHFHQPKYNHGVTTRLFDRFFGTFQKVDIVRVPRKMAMDWLLDQHGHLKPEYSAHFSLK